MKKYFLIGLVFLLLIISSCKNANQETSNSDLNENKIATENQNTMQENQKQINTNSQKTNIITQESSFSASGNILAGTKTLFIDFNKEDYDKALSENRVIFLYFYANWCPICREEIKQTYAAFNGLGNENVVGFQVNYKDSNTDKNEIELAKQFGITYQHTKVIIKNGERILKDGNSWNKETYINEINKYG